MIYIIFLILSVIASLAGIWKHLWLDSDRLFVEEIRTDVKRNIYGKVVRYETQYCILRRALPFCNYFAGYLQVHRYDGHFIECLFERKTFYSINRFILFIKTFDTREEAEALISDIRLNPDKYIIL